MSEVANWSYTAKATIWRSAGKNYKTGVATFHEPEVIYCDYGGSQNRNKWELGREFAIKDILYTEYPHASIGDYILIGESAELDPIAAGANEIIAIQRFADTFNRDKDDYSLMTGVASGSFR